MRRITATMADVITAHRHGIGVHGVIHRHGRHTEDNGVLTGHRVE
ncbi:MAG TPA: hypothetical protein VMA74_05505 [Dyella sp.]|nr:hypothetical protein [Dyella sp.]HUB89171.1 hypothetical protein [Dyella sp.]